MRLSRLLVVGLAAACLWTPAFAAADHRLRLHTERAIVFKDGYCLIAKRGTAKTDQNGEVVTVEIPDSAVLGSVWAQSSTGTIRSMTAGWSESTCESSDQVVCINTLDILRANLGKRCSLTVANNRTMEGIIHRVLCRHTMASDSATDAADPFADSPSHRVAGSVAEGTGSEQLVEQSNGEQFVLRKAAGDVLIAINQIRELTIDQMVTTMPRKTVRRERTRQLRIRFDQPNANVDLRLMYFRPGIRWIPTYRIELDRDDPSGVSAANDQAPLQLAHVSLQAEIINEAEDLVDVPIDVVVGVPHFRFREVPSPLSLEKLLRNALWQAAPRLMGRDAQITQLSNAMFSQRSGEYRGDQAAESNADQSAYPDELTATATNDLYVYSLPALRLSRGDRATVPIQSVDAQYRDVYTWHVRLRHTESIDAGRSTDSSPQELSQNQVWRHIELINSGDIPWTTGPALLTDGLQPLAQELLTYTAAKSTCRIPVTVAVDLQAMVDDREIERQLNALKFDRSNYSRVTGQVEINLKNNKPTAVEVEIELELGGKAVAASGDGQVSLHPFRPQDWIHYQGDPAVNHSSNVLWNATVPAGKAFAADAQYQLLIRH